MDHQTERDRQISEARDREQRGTLHTRTGSSPKRRYDNNGGKPAVKFAKGHDAVLKGMQDNGSLCRVQPIHGDLVVGKVLNRDRYTITLDVNGTKRVIYKHAIEFFEEVTVEEGNGGN